MGDLYEYKDRWSFKRRIGKIDDAGTVYEYKAFNDNFGKMIGEVHNHLVYEGIGWNKKMIGEINDLGNVSAFEWTNYAGYIKKPVGEVDKDGSVYYSNRMLRYQCGVVEKPIPESGAVLLLLFYKANKLENHPYKDS